MMIESAIPSGIMRTLSEQEHSEYRRPFLEPGESRRPLYSFVSSIPMDCEPADVYSMQQQTFSWIHTAEMPILFIRGDPGSSVTKEEADVIRQFRKVTEEVVKGKHLLTEDSPSEIGAAITKWYGAL